jgi:hypothetical protein
MMKFYKFRQRESGGDLLSICVRGATANHFWVEAESEGRADRIFELEIGFSHSHCSCCGQRFDECSGYEAFEGTLDELIAHRNSVKMFWGLDNEPEAALIENGLKAVMLPTPARHLTIGSFRKQTKTLKEPLPRFGMLVYQDGKLLRIESGANNYNDYRVEVLCEVNSAVSAVKWIEEQEMVSELERLTFQGFLDSAKRFDNGQG